MPLDGRFDVADLLVDRRATHFWENEGRVSDALADVPTGDRRELAAEPA